MSVFEYKYNKRIKALQILAAVFFWVLGSCLYVNAAIKISFEPNRLDFPNTEIGYTASQNLKIIKSGYKAAVVSAVDISSDVFTVELPVGTTVNATLPVLVQFKPTADKTYKATINILFQHKTKPDAIPISGRGIKNTPSPPLVYCSPLDIAFDDTEAGVAKYGKITCSNSGEEPAKLLSVNFTGDGASAFSIANHSELKNDSTIEGSDSKILWIQFSPSSSKQYAAQASLLWDYTTSETPVTLTGRGIPKGSDGVAYQYYQYSEIPEQFAAYAGQGQLFILELMGSDIAIKSVHSYDNAMAFDTVLEQPAVNSVFDPEHRDGHYIYVLSMLQNESYLYPRSQISMFNFDMNMLYNSLTMGEILNIWPDWTGSSVPIINVDIDDHKAVYVDDNACTTLFTMNVDVNWKKSPESGMSGDFYIILANQAGNKIYCYDIQEQDFNACNPMHPSKSSVQPPFMYHNTPMPFYMPVDETGVWRIYLGLVMEDGSVFYDQSAVIVRQALNGKNIEIY